MRIIHIYHCIEFTHPMDMFMHAHKSYAFTTDYKMI